MISSILLDLADDNKVKAFYILGIFLIYIRKEYFNCDEAQAMSPFENNYDYMEALRKLLNNSEF